MTNSKKAIDALYKGNLDEMRAHVQGGLKFKMVPVLEAKKQEVAKSILVKENKPAA